MTLIGKTLVFVVLVIAVGICVFATATYTQRRPWFMPTPEGGVDKGNYFVTFALLKTEIDALGNAATAASGAWGANLRELEAKEKLRADRQARMFGVRNADGSVKTKGLLDFARQGNPKPGEPAADAPGFYRLKEDPATRLLDLTDLSATDPGPDKVPLRGADQLLARINADAKAQVDLAAQSQKLRQRQKELSGEIAILDTQVAKQRVIRDHQLNEAAYLAAFEINLVEQRQIVGSRQRQLVEEMKRFGAGPKAEPKGQ
jgi:hypothetical protein